MSIRLAKLEDFDELWEIFRQIIRTGDTYVYSPTTKKSEFKSIWFRENMETYVAEMDKKIQGSYFLKPNQVDFGSHVANAGYMVKPNAQGKGTGRALCEHSIEKASDLGYKAMQFNFVVSTNKYAIKLWISCGFEIIGTIPRAFDHQKFGFVDAHIMYKVL